MKKLLSIFLLIAVIGFCCNFAACSTDTAIQPILSAGSEGPVFTGYKAVSSGFEFEFSQPVKILNAVFNPYKEVVSIEDGRSVKIELQPGLEAGMKLTADILVEDEYGNTLNVLVPVRSRNDRMPQLLINEVRTEYAKPKVEFIEFKTESAGNLAALRVFAAGMSLDEPIYEFPSAEVKSGEYVVLYLRTLDPASVDETGSDLDLSPGAETSATSREFWVPGTTKLSRKTEIFFIKDQDDQILDAVMMSENQNDSWSKENLAAAASLLGSNAAWSSNDPAPSQAVFSQYATATRTICRDESISDSNSADDWYITAASSATPGAANNEKRYVPKN
jgi:hypothetical protein